MDHIHKLNLESGMFYIGINNSHTNLSLETDLKFDQEDGSINFRRIYSMYL